MRDEHGFTLIELLMAVFIVAVALIALMSTLDTSRELVTDTEVHETVTHQAEREMERVLALPYDDVALTSAPATSSDPTDPRYYVSAGPPARYQWDQGDTGPQSGELVVTAAGAVDPVSAWEDGESRLSGSVHSFVTCDGEGCSDDADDRGPRRITIAVTVDGHPDQRPALISSIKVDPNATG